MNFQSILLQEDQYAPGCLTTYEMTISLYENAKWQHLMYMSFKVSTLHYWMVIFVLLQNLRWYFIDPIVDY